MATVRNLRVNLQTGTDRTVYATWTWSYKTGGEERTDNYAVQWFYNTGNGVWFEGSDTSVKNKQSVYNAPSNARSVKVRVRPVAKTYKTGSGKNQKTVSYFTASWSSGVIYYITPSTNPDKPSTPTVNIDRYTMTASVANYSDTRANRICFQIVRNDNKTVLTQYGPIKTTASSISVPVTVGYQYKVRCRAEKYRNNYATRTVKGKKEKYVKSITVVAKSEWTDYSSNAGTIPSTPSIIIRVKNGSKWDYKTKAINATSFRVEWNAVATATSYTVEYTDNKAYFDSSSETHTTTSTTTHAEVTGLETGKVWYFRVRATNSVGDSGNSSVQSLTLGSKPAAPTTWAESTTLTVGDTARLYWMHNSQDGSDEKRAAIEITIGNGTPVEFTRYVGTGVYGTSTTPTIFSDSGVSSAKVDDYYINSYTYRYYRCTTAGAASVAKWVFVSALTALEGYYPFNTSSLSDGSEIKWRVKTMGATLEYGPWSTSRTVTVYAPPTISLELLPVTAVDENGDPSEFGESAETITSYPFVLRGEAGPVTQVAVGYIVTVTAQNNYETLSQTGETVQVIAGEDIFSQYYSATSNNLDVLFSAGNIDLANGESYTITCSVSMDSGLTAENSIDFDISWEEEDYEPNAEIGLGMADYTAIIQPYCYYINTEDEDEEEEESEESEESEDREGELVENVTLSVYRRTYDGQFVEIARGLQNDGVISVTDPHPSLDYARYRIVAMSTLTGKVSFYDVPGIPFDEITGIVIQWNEEWQDFNKVMLSEDEAAVEEEASYAASMVVLPYNVDVSDTHSPDVTFAKYIGREHPTSYYGTQLGITARWSTEIPAEDEETLFALRRLAVYQGDVYVREPSGSGYWAQVKVGLDIRHMALTIPVSFDITRVDGGI